MPQVNALGQMSASPEDQMRADAARLALQAQIAQGQFDARSADQSESRRRFDTSFGEQRRQFDVGTQQRQDLANQRYDYGREMYGRKRSDQLADRDFATSQNTYRLQQAQAGMRLPIYEGFQGQGSAAPTLSPDDMRAIYFSEFGTEDPRIAERRRQEEMAAQTLQQNIELLSRVAAQRRAAGDLEGAQAAEAQMAQIMTQSPGGPDEGIVDEMVTAGREALQSGRERQAATTISVPEELIGGLGADPLTTQFTSEMRPDQVREALGDGTFNEAALDALRAQLASAEASGLPAAYAVRAVQAPIMEAMADEPANSPTRIRGMQLMTQILEDARTIFRGEL